MPLDRPSPRGSVQRAVLWFVGITLLVLLLGMGAFFLYDRSLREKYEPLLAGMSQELTLQVGFFCEQQTGLARDPWFHEPRTEGDAGPLLNAWLPWNPGRPLPPDSPLTVPAALPQTSGDLKQWLTASIDVSTLDFDWMRQLRAHDHWDLVRHTPFPPVERFDWASAPIPNMIPLILWSKFRLLHGLRTGEPLEAARDVRHLAWLAYRSDTLIGGAIAKTLLALERQAHDSLPSPPAGWKPMSLEQLERMHAVVMSGPAFSQLIAPVEVAQRARTCGEPVVSRCIALAETAALARYLRPIAQEQYPEAYTAFAEALATAPCSTSLARTAWERGTTLEDLPGAERRPDQPYWLDNPLGSYFGSRMAGILLSMSQKPQALEAFRKKLEAGEFATKDRP